MAAKIGCLVMDFKFHPWGLLCYVNNFNDQERILTTGNICSLHIKYALMMQEFRFIFCLYERVVNMEEKCGY